MNNSTTSIAQKHLPEMVPCKHQCGLSLTKANITKHEANCLYLQQHMKSSKISHQIKTHVQRNQQTEKENLHSQKCNPEIQKLESRSWVINLSALPKSKAQKSQQEQKPAPLEENQSKQQAELNLPAQQNPTKSLPPSFDLIECGQGCGRKFGVKVIDRHEKICKKVSKVKRPVFNSRATRTIASV